MSDLVRSGLADFLRSRRGRLTREAVGLAGGRRRRTPGLRREEVAELAGIGVDWYVRLEQGRPVSPSSATVDALARALRLDKAEHAHLRTLALAPRRTAFVRETLPETLARVVESLDQPAYVTGRRWDVLAWNAAASTLFGDFGGWAQEDRNILVFLLTTPEARRLFGEGWAGEARRVVAQFRAVHDLRAGDPAFDGLRDRLQRACPEFDRWWETHDVAEPSSGRKRLHGPEGDACDYVYATLQANDDPALKLAIYARAG